MARITKSLLIPDEGGLIEGHTYAVGPLKVYGDEKFQPVVALLYDTGVGVRGYRSEPRWAVELRGPVLTKTGKHHKTRNHSRTYGPGRYGPGRYGPGRYGNWSDGILPDGRGALTLFTAAEIEEFVNALREQQVRYIEDVAAVTRKTVADFNGLTAMVEKRT
jgi:hypothetical protein